MLTKSTTILYPGRSKRKDKKWKSKKDKSVKIPVFVHLIQENKRYVATEAAEQTDGKKRTGRKTWVGEAEVHILSRIKEEKQRVHLTRTEWKGNKKIKVKIFCF